ncbi:hypothetical protein Q8A73_010600 [Channa argus]|nr:hypothetical protein Q8A73_010600 [Channa argus]
MSPVKTVHVPGLGSQQRHEPQVDQTLGQAEPRSQCRRPEKRGKKRARGEKTQFLLKVKLPKLSSKSLTEKMDKSSPRWRFAANKNIATVGGGGETPCAASDCHSVGVDDFCFFQGPTSKATNQHDKDKYSVLRTISKMLKENQLIRRRLAALSQTN